ncbi:MAG TPA: tRNA lysidine(34) synthetase TilS [Candidatus Baltobacteraceae bacterium]|jgi:tRNA(Ile)-lysidine synthase|nr:tRNA lysidine(34) synthetase TilS [Candidatus Baltobacteraceae bacterium]
MDRLQVSGRPATLPIRWIRAVEQAIVERKLFRDGQTILVAVSGGLDSMTLLHALRELSRIHRWKLTVAHFNHQLRGRAADADERLVRNTARALNLPFVGGRGDVRAAARREGISLEMAGRDLRHRFLARAARARRIGVIALAHHADDQVELFFLRLFRGTGGQGLSGMKWSSPSPADPTVLLVRPLLAQSRAALRQAAGAAAVSFREDATNAQFDMERNRIRHTLIPMLRKYFPARLTETVPRLMELAGAEADAVASLAAKWLKARRRPKFSQLPVAVQRSVIQLQLFAIKHTPAFDLVEHLRARPGEPLALDAGRTVSRNPAGTLHTRGIEQIGFNPARRAVLLTGGKGELRIGGLALCWQIERTTGAGFTKEPNVEYFDADKVGSRICLRHWQAGDRFQPIGVASPRKLQDLLTNAKVPRGERHRRIVAATIGGEPFWVEGLRMAEPFKLEPATVRRLKWHWRREG